MAARIEHAATHLWSQADDLAPSLHAEVCAHHAANTRPKHFALIVQENSSVVVESDEAAVWSSDCLPRPDDHGASDVAPAHFDSVACGRGGSYWACAFYDADNLVADGAPTIVDLLPEDVDALDEECSRVVYDLLGCGKGRLGGHDGNSYAH